MTYVYVEAGLPTAHYQEVVRHIHLQHPNEGVILHTAATSLVPELRNYPIPTFIGGELIPYTGSGTRYFQGMMDPSWRWASILACEQAAKNLAPQIPNHVGWYLSEEANLTDLLHSGLRSNVEAYMIELIRRLYSYKPLPFIWSPWVGGVANPIVTTWYRRMVESVVGWLKSYYGLTIDLRVHLQDGVGTGFHSITQAGAWGKILASATSKVGFAMNVEHFHKVGGILVYRDPSSAIAHYDSVLNLAIGSAWEARYWYPFSGYTSNHAH